MGNSKSKLSKTAAATFGICDPLDQRSLCLSGHPFNTTDNSGAIANHKGSDKNLIKSPIGECTEADEIDNEINQVDQDQAPKSRAEIHAFQNKAHSKKVRNHNSISNVNSPINKQKQPKTKNRQSNNHSKTKNKKHNSPIGLIKKAKRIVKNWRKKDDSSKDITKRKNKKSNTRTPTLKKSQPEQSVVLTKKEKITPQQTKSPINEHQGFLNYIRMKESVPEAWMDSQHTYYPKVQELGKEVSIVVHAINESNTNDNTRCLTEVSDVCEEVKSEPSGTDIQSVSEVPDFTKERDMFYPLGPPFPSILWEDLIVSYSLEDYRQHLWKEDCQLGQGSFSRVVQASSIKYNRFLSRRGFFSPTALNYFPYKNSFSFAFEISGSERGLARSLSSPRLFSKDYYKMHFLEKRANTFYSLNCINIQPSKLFYQYLQQRVCKERIKKLPDLLKKSSLANNNQKSVAIKIVDKKTHIKPVSKPDSLNTKKINTWEHTVTPLASPYSTTFKEKSLVNEVEILKRVRHPSIIQLYAYCHSKIFDESREEDSAASKALIPAETKRKRLESSIVTSKEVEERYTRFLSQARLWPKSFCMVLPYCQGGELFGLIKDYHPSLSSEVISRIFYEIASATDYLHKNNIVHRDIKLENVMINVPIKMLQEFSLLEECTSQAWKNMDKQFNRGIKYFQYSIATLCDFGLSTSIDPKNPMLESGCGSLEYIAPEVMLNGGYDGRQTDVWSLGVLLYAMMERKLPFDPRFYPRLGKIHHRIVRIDWRWNRFSFYNRLHDRFSNEYMERTGGVRRLFLVNGVSIRHGGLPYIGQQLWNGAMDIVQQCLIRREGRITMKEILNHPWVIRAAPHSLQYFWETDLEKVINDTNRFDIVRNI